jgi:hypothetical protein
VNRGLILGELEEFQPSNVDYHGLVTPGGITVHTYEKVIDLLNEFQRIRTNLMVVLFVFL